MCFFGLPRKTFFSNKNLEDPRKTWTLSLENLRIDLIMVSLSYIYIYIFNKSMVQNFPRYLGDGQFLSIIYKKPRMESKKSIFLFHKQRFLFYLCKNSWYIIKQ